jgi:hypothetical protein
MSEAVAAIGASITIDSTPIAEIRDISGPEFSTDEVDVTSHDSPDFGEEVLPTIKRWGSISFPMNLVAGDAGQEALAAAWEGRTVDNYVLTLTNGATVTFSGFVSSFGVSAAVTDINMVDVTIRPTEAPTIDWGS